MNKMFQKVLVLSLLIISTADINHVLAFPLGPPPPMNLYPSYPSGFNDPRQYVYLIQQPSGLPLTQQPQAAYPPTPTLLHIPHQPAQVLLAQQPSFEIANQIPQIQFVQPYDSKNNKIDNSVINIGPDMSSQKPSVYKIEAPPHVVEIVQRDPVIKYTKSNKNKDNQQANSIAKSIGKAQGKKSQPIKYKVPTQVFQIVKSGKKNKSKPEATRRIGKHSRKKSPGVQYFTIDSLPQIKTLSKRSYKNENFKKANDDKRDIEEIIAALANNIDCDDQSLKDYLIGSNEQIVKRVKFLLSNKCKKKN